jgi:hypothetical protein
LVAGDVKGLVGVLELPVQVLDRMFDTESFGGSFASVQGGLAAGGRVETSALASWSRPIWRERMSAAGFSGSSGDTFQVLAFVAEVVQVGVEHPALHCVDVDASVDGEFLGVTFPQRRTERVERRRCRFGGVLLVFAFGLFNEIDAVVVAAA